jgi:soluble lytic murein transglycosylase-like protein
MVVRRFKRPGLLLPLAGALALASIPAAALGGQTGFAKVLASSDKGYLTEWGRRYEHGEGVRKSVDRAIRLYCKAAKMGHAEAQYFLGYIYANGRGVKRDDALAAGWFQAAAKNGDRHARNMLRVVRSKPRGGPECLLSDGSAVGAERKRFASHPAKGHIADLIRSLAPEYRLDPNLVLAVVEAESNFDAKALSHKNAQGLMQLIPATAERFGVEDVWDPEQNLRGGMSYLRWLLDHFDGDVRLALAGYNAGEEAVRRYRGVPPYSETRNYVARIARRLDL